MISQSSIDDIKPGVTTREDVLINFGNPSVRLDNDRTLEYQWRETTWVYFWWWTNLRGGTLYREHNLYVQFDDNGRVEKVEQYVGETHAE